jgi:DNA repair exonuclease SbcCD ATPase subunit
MTDKVLEFTNIKLAKMPGFMSASNNLELEDLESGINIIYGPNAVGKSTLAQAFQHLLWPEQAPETAVVEGGFKLEESDWQVNLEGSQAAYRREGSPHNPPARPGVETKDRYYLALHDLLQKETRGKPLAQIIRQESAGGYQVSKAAEELGFKETPNRRNKRTRQADKKIKSYRQARRSQKGLKEEERKLSQLRQELEEIKTARQELKAVEQALALAQIKEDYAAKQAELDQFSPEIDKLNGTEVDKLEDINQRLSRQEQKLAAAQERLQTAEETLAGLNLPEAGLKQEELTAMKDKQATLKSLETEIDNLKAEISQAQLKETEERGNFIDLAEIEDLTKLDGAAYNELSDFARRAERIHNRLEAVETLKELLNLNSELPAEKKTVQRGIQYLEDWLKSEGAGGEKERTRLRYLSLLSGTVISGLSAVMGSLLNPWWFFGLAPAVGIVGYGLKYSGSKSGSSTFKTRFEQLSLSAPDKWTVELVRDRLEELYNLRAEIEFQLLRQRSWEERETE